MTMTMPSLPTTRKMPPERRSVTKRFSIGDLKGYLTVGLYDDGTPGEVFLILRKPGALERGLAHCVAIMISLLLQNGIPLSKVISKLKGLQFDPAGVTGDPEIPMAHSIADYLGRWLELRFQPKTPPEAKTQA
jgi:ribonucleoside-diphosphate reductase alpha chain